MAIDFQETFKAFSAPIRRRDINNIKSGKMSVGVYCV